MGGTGRHMFNLIAELAVCSAVSLFYNNYQWPI